MSKYNAKKTTVGTEIYDSQFEAFRHQQLKLLERAGEIRNLRRQVPFVLIPSQRVGNVKERAVSYIADFVYDDSEGSQIVEDAKGVKTKEYVIKRKLMLYIHGIAIKEVYKS